MSCSAADLATWANTCPCTDEAHARAIISRAYYAAFHDSKAFAATLKAPGALHPRLKGEHVNFAHQLSNPALECKRDQPALAQSSRDRGRLMTALHARRCDADYKLSLDIGADDAQQALSDMQAIMSLN